MMILGPGSVGETTGDWGVTYGDAWCSNYAACWPHPASRTSTRFPTTTTGRLAALRRRWACRPRPDAALSEQWLANGRNTGLLPKRARPVRAGQAVLATETADAACGGNPWAATFLDTFRYLDQLGRLAKQEVRVVAHNTLVASDYGLLDEKTLTPKPNYWAALLWRRLMGTTVLESGVPIQPGLHVYAHCLRGTPGGVAMLAINTDKAAARTVTVPTARERYTLSAKALQSKSVLLNGTELALGAADTLPAMTGNATAAGTVTLAPTTITFLAIPTAGNGC